MAVLSRLLPVAACSYGLQSLFGAIFIPLQDDRFYDFLGTMGFLASAFISLYQPALLEKYRNGTPLPSIFTFGKRQFLATAALGLWGTRLGLFLVRRSLKAGGDGRLSEIKKNPRRFFYYWMAQATWGIIVGLPVYLIDFLPAQNHPEINQIDYAGLTLYAASLIAEIIADRQKSAWRAAKEKGLHNEKFITQGLWSLSRHPNYCSEIGIWTGIWALCFSSLRAKYPSYMPGVALLSPIVQYLMLKKLSGVPPLERMAEKKWGNDPAWKLYKERVPVFFPWIRP